MQKLTKVKSVTSNFLSVLMGEVLATGISLLTALTLANGLGAALFGLVSIATSLTEVFFSVSDMGMQSWSIREIARHPDSVTGIARSLSKAKIYVALAIFFSFTSVSFFVYGPSIFFELFIFFAFSLVADTFTLVLYSVFQAIERMYFYSASRVLATSVFFIGSFITVQAGSGIIFVGFSYMLSRFSALGFSLFVAFAFHLFQGNILDVPVSSVFKSSAPFAALVILSSLIPRSDVVMLSFLFVERPELAGVFSAALRIFLVTTMLASSLLIGLYPLLSSSFVSDNSMFKYAAQKTQKYLLIGGVLMSLLFVFSSNQIISFLYNPEYTQAGILLMILGGASFLTFLRMSFEWIFNSANMQNKVVRCSLVRFVANIIFNFSVFYIGLIGIALASVVAEVLAILCSLHYTHQSELYALRPIATDLLRVAIVASLTLFISSLIIPFLGLSGGLLQEVVKSGLLVIVFGALSLIFVINKDDIRLLRDALSIS